MNISSSKLEEEECEPCIRHDLHSCNSSVEILCEECSAFEKHNMKAGKGRDFYKSEAQSNLENTWHVARRYH